MTYRRTLSTVLPLAATLALSACAGMGGEEPAAPARPTTATASPSRPARPAPAPPPARPAVKNNGELKALRPAPRPETGGEAAAPSLPPKLVGLSEDETVGLLGRPAEESEQPPGKVWLYRAGGCQLSVHLFPDMERGGFYALDYAAEGGRDACLGKVAGEARKRGSALPDQSAKTG